MSPVLPAMLLWVLAAAPSNEPFFQERLIFPPQAKHVHSSSLVECPDGDLLCAWFHGSGERESRDVVILGARLRNSEPAWSAVFPLADTPNLPDCNPVLFVDGDQQLWLYWIAVPAERWEDSLLRCRRAREYTQDGPPQWDWQDDLLLEPGDRFAEEMARRYAELRPLLPGLDDPRGPAIRQTLAQLQLDAWDKSKRQRGWMTRCHLTVLPSGRILLPLYSDGFLVCLMAISDDQAKSWRPSSPIVGVGLNQPSVVRRRDGTLLAYMREDEGLKHRILLSESRDDGETWSLAASTDIPNPNSSLEVLALRDGRWVMVYNRSEIEDDRHILTIALSQDEGKTWPWQRDLESTPGGRFHYPSVIQTRDGRVHVSYTHQGGPRAGRSIKHVTLDADWIGDGGQPR